MPNKSSEKIDKSQVGADVIPLRSEAGSRVLDVTIDTKSPSRLAELLWAQLGEVAVDIVSAVVYRYTGSFWEQMSDAMLRRVLAATCKENGVPYGRPMLAVAVGTMKDMIPLIENPRDNLVGFANGVYDLATRQFRSHSPSDGLRSHNGITYEEPTPNETLEACAPNFINWLNHAVGRDAAKADRILAALFMMLANRYDWQLFLEVTGEGGSGKSIMAYLSELLVGKQYIGSSSMRHLESEFGLENLWDKRLILLPDQAKYAGDGATLKAISGGDLVSINRKGKPMFSAKVRAVVLATNNVPMVMTERNGGIARRRVIFSFNNVVAEADQDSKLDEKIATELPVIIRHLLERFADHDEAKKLLREQRNSADAIVVKRDSDPLFDLCSMVEFIAVPNGLRMGGKTDIKREPRKFFYHLYLTYMEYHGMDRPLSVNAVSRALKQMAKELGREYQTRSSNGTITNIVITDEVESFMPRTVVVD